VVKPKNINPPIVKLRPLFKDTADIVRDSGVQLANDELQRLAVTLFITRSQAA
jgi:hypothetical protein